MVSFKLLLVMLVAKSVSASGQWPFSLWRNEKQVGSLVELSKAKEAVPSFYHTTPEISQKLANMNCAGMSYRKATDSGVSLDVVQFKPAKENEEVKHKVMVVAGEHAREMIGTETALGFVQELCKESMSARKNSEYLVVVNANPQSRALVESGDTCRRVNLKGVDINRNWGDNWASAGEQNNFNTNPGMYAFSEPESRILKNLMEEFQPHTFLDVHSGTLGLYLPNQLSSKDAYAKTVESFISEVNQENCRCPLGIANEEVGYQTSGSSLDYAADKVGTRFAIAMEVWAHPNELHELRERWEEQKQRLNQKPSAFLEMVPKYNLIKSEEKIEQALQGKSAEECFAFFNPTEEAMYHKTVEKWSKTLLELSIKGRDIPTESTSLLQKPDETEQKLPVGHILRVGAILLLMFGLWFLWQRFSHLVAKNKDVEAAPLTQPMGPIQVSD